MTAIYYTIVFLPFVAAILMRAFSKNSFKLSSAITIATTVFIAALSIIVFISPAETANMSGFSGLGISLSSGSFPKILMVLTTCSWVVATIISPEYFKGENNVSRYYMFHLFTLGAVLGVFLAQDLGTVFIFFEIMSVCSYVWVVQNETPDALIASKTYLYISIIGGLVMLFGVFLLYSDTKDLTFAALSSTGLTYGRKLTAGICILTGFGIKAGMFPLHVWLPRSYPAAPAPATALLSSILSKSGVFGIIIITVRIFCGDNSWGVILIVLATATMLLGALLALFSSDLKRTLACSSMSQIGFILLGIGIIGLTGEEYTLAASGVSLHMINHSLIKLALFTAAGIIFKNLGSLDYNKIRGYGKGKPVFIIGYVLGAASIAGIPGFSGYISKTLLHEGIVEAIHISHASWLHVIEWLFLIAGGCTFAYMSKILYVLFIAKAPSEKQTGKYIGLPAAVSIVASAILFPLLGITAGFSMQKIANECLAFFSTEPLENFAYYSFANLKGALTSIGIGIVIFIFVELLAFTRKKDGVPQFKNYWPEKLDLEYLFYQPLLKVLEFIGTLIARSISSAVTFFIYGIVNIIFYKAKKRFISPVDHNFGKYNKVREKRIVGESFSSDLLYTGIGIIVIIFFVAIGIMKVYA